MKNFNGAVETLAAIILMIQIDKSTIKNDLF